MESLSEADIIAGLRSGDPDAYRRSYERYKSDVLALVATMLGHQDGAWDVLHTVFVEFASCARNLAPDSNLRAYLLTAAANRARDYLRSRRDLPHLGDNVDAVICPESEEPPELLARQENEDRLRQVVMALPEDQRTVVALHIYGDLTFKKIAEMDGVSENTVASRYRYAIEKLRRSNIGACQ